MTQVSESAASRIVLERQVVRGCTVVTLAGELDLGVASELRRALISMASARDPHVVVDLGLVDFMDCSALGVLVCAHREARTAGGCLRIVGPRHGAARLLQASGLDGVFCLCATLDAATGSACLSSRHTGQSGT